MVGGQIKNDDGVVLLQREVKKNILNEGTESIFVVPFSGDHVFERPLLIGDHALDLQSSSVLIEIRNQIQFEFVISPHPSLELALPGITRSFIDEKDFCIHEHEMEQLDDKLSLQDKHLLFCISRPNPVTWNLVIDIVPFVPSI